MSGGFFRGTSAEQDTRFSNKQAKLLKSQKFAPELDILVDISKVKMDIVKPWIASRVTELLGFEDEVLINFIYGLLDAKDVNGKEVQISLTGFMEKNTGKFMKELWTLLLSAQRNASGVPQQFLDAKEEETRRKKVESDRIAGEIKKRKERENRELEEEQHKMMDGGADGLKMSGSISSPTKFSRPHEDVETGVLRNDSRGGISMRHKSRSLSRSPLPRQRSTSANRRSSTPRRATPPRRPISPWKKSLHSRRRSASQSPSPSRPKPTSPLSLAHHNSHPIHHRYSSPSRHVSKSPVGRLSPSNSPHSSLSPHLRRTSPYRSPISLRYRASPGRRPPSPTWNCRSPSPYRKSPIRHYRSPIRHRRSPLPVRRRRSPSPDQRRMSPSPVHLRRSPSPVRRRRSPPFRRKRPPSSSPIHGRRSPSPVRRRMSPSPIRHRRLPSPIRQRRLPSPVRRRRSPFPIGCQRLPSPIQDRRLPYPRHHMSPSSHQVSRSPVPQRYRSPSTTSKNVSVSPEVIQQQKFSQSESSRVRSRSREETSLICQMERESHRASSPRAQQRICGVEKDHKRGVSSLSFASDKSPDNSKGLRGHGKIFMIEPSSQNEFGDIPVEKTTYSHGLARENEEEDRNKSAREAANAKSRPSPLKLKDLQRQQVCPGGIQSKSPTSGEDSHEHGKAAGHKLPKKNKKDSESDGSESSDSSLEDKREAKRRRKERRILRREERRRRREERRRRREERRAERRRRKLVESGAVQSDNHAVIERDGHVSCMDERHLDPEETESEQRRLETELRRKALESLKAKKGIRD